MSRRTDREHAFKLLFQLPFHQTLDPAQALAVYFDDLSATQEVDREFVYQEFSGAAQNVSRIDEYIAAFADKWALDRLARVDLAIMRLAVYEILYQAGIPVRVSINEAVELTKLYGTDDSPGFVNGILGRIAAKIDQDQDQDHKQKQENPS